MRAGRATAGPAGGTGAVVSVVVAGLTALLGWLLATVVAVAGLATVLPGLLLFVPADGPVNRFERIVAALRRTAPPPGCRPAHRLATSSSPAR